MQIVVRTESAEAELDVGVDRGASPAVTLGHLVGLLTPEAGHPTVTVDGRRRPASTPFVGAGLRRASIVDLTAAVDAAPDAGEVEVAVVAGVGTGYRRALPAGRYRIGPGAGPAPLADGTVAEPVAEIDTDRHERLVLGDRVVAVRPAPLPGRALGAPDADGTTVLHRPPRPAPPPDPPPIEVPAAAREPTEPRHFPVLASLAPLPIAAGVAAVLGEWRYLLFGLLSPAMLVANWVEERRAGVRQRRRAAAADRRASAELAGELARRHADDTRRALAAQPDVAAVVAWAERGDPRLWERRTADPDALTVVLGAADQPWRPALSLGRGPIAGVDELVQALGSLPAVPVVADLRGGIGLVGGCRRDAARGLLLHAVATHGPADLGVLVLADEPSAWEWTKWLPHAITPDGAVIADPGVARDVVAAGATGDRRLLVVADGDRWWRGRDAPLRGSVPGRHCVVALVDEAERLPSACATIVAAVAAPSHVDLAHGAERLEDVAVALVDEDVALRAARALARFSDPDLPAASSASGPVRLLDLLDLHPDDADAVAARWCRRDRRPRAPIGAGSAGTVTVDLAVDGPHGLVAGTTGSGKSELLRTLVAGLAATLPPEELNVVLVDFKGGAAFDACADLPHTVGLVTDLDEHLAARVLRCLRAELVHRERVLRAAGVSSLDGPSPGGAPMPRLVVVIDEFAALSAQLPDFVPGLVDIAQRGRSLGVHLVLATQRPAGVVDQRIKANTDLRVALRVQDDADSIDVVGVRDAAALPRNRPGRAVVRFAAGDVVTLQTALSTVVSGGAERPLTVRAFVHHRPLTGPERRVGVDPDGHAADDAPSDLRRLVGAIARAATGRPRPRRPYLEPLPPFVGAADLHGDGAPAPAVPYALVDRPDEQRCDTRWWTPGSSLAAFGVAGSGTTSLLASLVLGLAATVSSDDAHVYVVDADAGGLMPLETLAPVGAVVRVDETDRLVRLAALLTRELDRRRAAPGAGGPTITLVVDNIGGLRHALEDDRRRGDVWPAFERVLRDGPALGIGAVVTARTERELPAPVAAAFTERLVLRMADPHAYGAFGFRPADVPTMVAGRALCARERVELQIVAPPPDLAAAVASAPAASAVRPPARVDPLPAVVLAGSVVRHATATAGGWTVPIGLDRRDGRLAVLPVRGGRAAVVAGPPRSGRSSLLAVVAAALAVADPATAVFGVGSRRTTMPATVVAPADAAGVAGWVERVATATGRRVVLVDDADELGGPSFERLAGTVLDGDIAVVLAGTADGLRRPGHWTRSLVSRTRTGVLLAPSAGDGDLLRAAVSAAGAAAGNAYLVIDGLAVPVLTAVPGPA